jgi:stress-induced morphogen
MQTSSSSSPPQAFPVTESIRQKLTAAFAPAHLEVINESHMHNVPANSETHFKVVVVSSRFDEVRVPLQRHRLVNGILAAELEGPVHALSIVAKSPSQWEASSSIPPSPSCKGGDGSLPPKKSST